MKALRFERKIAKFAAANVLSRVMPGVGGSVGPISLDDIDPPKLPGPDWVRIQPLLAGICGSDLSTLDGTSSRYFEPIVSFPFTPGHEIVAQSPMGRVVVEPVLGCVARNIAPVCAACVRGDLGNCERLAFGDIKPGLQCGYCASTGGGWSAEMVAHPSQLHIVPDDLSDRDAVMIEPLACGIHAALRPALPHGATVAFIGAGTLGLCTIAALAWLRPDVTLLVGARYPQQIGAAKLLGATHVVPTSELARRVRSLTGSFAYGDQLTGGVDAVFDCVGSSDTITQALAVVKPRGTVVCVGMPASVNLDLTTLWHREVSLVGAYAYGTEHLADGTTRRTFDLAIELAQRVKPGHFVSATYRLDDYSEAISHAANAGRRGAIKVCFDPTPKRPRSLAAAAVSTPDVSGAVAPTPSKQEEH
jgi:threonine dehydrogenase-like Zn-dependent dehydrogenase